MTKFIFGVYQSFGIVIPRSRSNSFKVWGEETSEKKYKIPELYYGKSYSINKEVESIGHRTHFYL